ncbi:MAG: hypothetical protein AAFZ49_10190, partial [Cyanobacteria bacterium J06659_2]
HEHVTGVSFAFVLLAFALGGFVTGIPSLLIYLGLARRHKLSPADGAVGLLTVTADSAMGLADVVKSAPSAVVETRKVIKGQKPLLPTLEELRSKDDEQAIAIKRENLLRSAIVVAPQHSGKTRYLLDDVQAFLETQDGQLYICDPNYGSSHDGEAPNTWFDLPLDEYVYDTEKDCLAVMKQISEIVTVRQTQKRNHAKARNKTPLTHEPILLLIDEESMINTYIADDNELRNRFIAWTRNLLQRGHKQSVFVKMVCHDTSTGTTGLPQPLFTQVDVILLGAAAVETKYLNHCDVDKAIATEVKAARQSNKRAYVTKISGEVKVNPMPFIPEPTMTYDVSGRDPWAAEHLSQERVAQLEAMPDDARIKEDIAMQVFGLSASRCRNTNEDYVRIKQAWEDVKQRRQQANSENLHDDTLHPEDESSAP